MEQIILILILLSVCIQCYFFIFIFFKLTIYKNTVVAHSSPSPISIVVCAHNELVNLQKLLPLLTSQIHPDFEIILVDDRSTDGSAAWLSSLDIKNLKVITIKATPLGWTGKKYALQLGVQAATNPIILLTDADCMPATNHWAREMTSAFTLEIDACIGYAPYQKEPTFLNKLIRFETLHTAMQYLSLTLAGMPYMGVGRNMAYSKKIFEKQNGLTSISHILGGDDDLFANLAFKKNRVQIQIAEDSFVHSIPKKTYNEWFIQKTRHLAVGKYYKLFSRFVLGLLMCSQAVFYISVFTLFFIQTYIAISLIGILFRTLVLIYIFVRLNIKLKEDFKWYWFPLLDIIFTFNYIYVGLNAYFFNRNKWK